MHCRLYRARHLGRLRRRPGEIGPAPCRFTDPRLAALGIRDARDARSDWALGGEDARKRDAGDYHAHRIALGVPEGGKDYAFGDAFPHEALSISSTACPSTKGCFVGQEVVSRMQNRGTARRRIVPVVADGRFPRAEPDHRRRRRDRHARLGRRHARAGTRYGSTAPPNSSKRARRCAPATFAVRIDIPAWARFSCSQARGLQHDRTTDATIVRCPWAGNGRRYQRYHDEEWGVP